MSLAHEKYVELQRLRNEAPAAVDPDATALVVIDMQEYFLDPDSPLARSCELQVPGVLEWYHARGREVVEPTLKRLLDFFRAHGMTVLYTTVASERSDGRDLMPLFQRRNAANHRQQLPSYIPQRDDEWARITPGLAPQPDEIVVNKTSYGTFNSTGLDRTLRNLGVDTLVVGGVVTNVCVETTARDAVDLGYEVIVVEDGCAAYSPEIQEAALLSFQGPFGCVRRADEIVALLETALEARGDGKRRRT